MIKPVKIAAVISFLLSTVGISNAATIVDFSPLGLYEGTLGPTYHESGITFTADFTTFSWSHNFYHNDSDSLYHYNASNLNSADHAGATLLLNYMGGLRIEKTNGGRFDLVSFDIAFGVAWLPPVSFDMSYIYLDDSGTHNGTLTYDRNLANSAGVKTFNINYSGIKSFVLANDYTSWQIDNVTVNSVGVVPEPETYILMIFGIGLVGFMVRRTIE